MDSILQNMDPEKRDKMINAAIEEFSLYPYERASTNNIVSIAGISKGLLFHYFGNKQDLHEWLIGFVLNKLFDEITSKIDWEERDIFERIKALIIIKVELGQMYPSMFNFVIKMLSEKNANSLEAVKKLYEKHELNIQDTLSDIYTKNIDFSLFRDPDTIDKCINISRWTMEKYTEESLLKIADTDSVDYEKIAMELDAYIGILKKMFY